MGIYCRGSNLVVDTDDLGIVPGRRLEKVGGIKVTDDIDIDAQLFKPFPLKPVDEAFAQFQATAREFNDLLPLTCSSLTSTSLDSLSQIL